MPYVLNMHTAGNAQIGCLFRLKWLQYKHFDGRLQQIYFNYVGGVVLLTFLRKVVAATIHDTVHACTQGIKCTRMCMLGLGVLRVQLTKKLFKTHE